MNDLKISTAKLAALLLSGTLFFCQGPIPRSFSAPVSNTASDRTEQVQQVEILVDSGGKQFSLPASTQQVASHDDVSVFSVPQEQADNIIKQLEDKDIAVSENTQAFSISSNEALQTVADQNKNKTFTAAETITQLNNIEPSIEEQTRQSSDNKSSNQNTSQIDVVLIDTGVADGSPNIIGSTSTISDDKGSFETTSDRNGHGTAMLSRILEEDPQASVWSVKAFDDNGIASIASVWAALDIAETLHPAVVNMSFSAWAPEGIPIIEAKIDKLSSEGIVVVGAAGNDGKDTINTVPGKVNSAWIVGACDETGKTLTSSNYGKTVDEWVCESSTSWAAAAASGEKTKECRVLVSDGSDSNKNNKPNNTSPVSYTETSNTGKSVPDSSIPANFIVETPKDSSVSPTQDGSSTKAEAYTIIFDGNNAIGYMSSLSAPYDDWYDMPRCGFGGLEGTEFAGWNTEPDGSGFYIPDGQAILGTSYTTYFESGPVDYDFSSYIKDNRLTLYAQWSSPLGQPRFFNIAVSPSD